MSLFNTMNVTLPRYFEVQTTVTGVKPTAGYIIFDYQSPTDFKFAGVNVSTNKLEIGHRTASGWAGWMQPAICIQAAILRDR